MKKKLLIIAVIAILLILLFGFRKSITESEQKRVTWWEFQSIDTMKYSRDVSREKLNEPSFDTVIEEQVKNIADTGATHVAIATPYDEEFYPILKRWVDGARRHNLQVWFRGNWSGWEGWFGYPKITRAEHIKKTQDFILKHQDIFEDGDVFSPCPECENGGPGDPRQNGDVLGHRKFLIDEYNVTKTAFKAINKNVASNFNSMNGDVARAVMDKKTTLAMDGIVAIDHYVSTPEKLISDIDSIAKASGGKIVLGEFGAPIPDINGKMTEKQQADWINIALLKLARTNQVIGISYWTNTGSSTALWSGDGKARIAAETLKSVFNAPVVSGVVQDEAGGGIGGAYIKVENRYFFTDSKGNYEFPYIGDSKTIKIETPEFHAKTVTIDPQAPQLIVLKKEKEDFLFKTKKFIHRIFSFLP